MSDAAERRDASARTAIALAGLRLAHAWFANELPRFRSPNTWSRLYLALAIAEQGRFSVDAQVARYGRLEDLALRLLGVSLPAVGFWFATRRLWAELAGGPRRGLAVLVASALGTPLFIYATTLFSHALAGMLAFTGFALVRSVARSPSPERAGDLRRIAAADFAIGWAFATDSLLLLAIPVLSAHAILCRNDGRGLRALALVAGAAGPALLLGLYHHVGFGSPVSVGSHHLADPSYREA